MSTLGLVSLSLSLSHTHAPRRWSGLARNVLIHQPDHVPFQVARACATCAPVLRSRAVQQRLRIVPNHDHRQREPTIQAFQQAVSPGSYRGRADDTVRSSLLSQSSGNS